MLILGITGGSLEEGGSTIPVGAHDGSACLVRDGEVVAAVEEERLNRLKHSTSFPGHAIRSCLDDARVSFSEVDVVAFNTTEIYRDTVLNQYGVVSQDGATWSSRDVLAGWFASELGHEIAEDQLIYVPHHRAHAMVTYTASGMEDALVAVIDGRGERHSSTMLSAGSGGLTALRSHPIRDSVGLFYLAGTMFLGYGWGDEYKVMGLAPHGDPATYRAMFESMYSFEDDGGYTLFHSTPNDEFDETDSPVFHMVRTCVANGLAPRRRGSPFLKQHQDFAAALQEAVERIVLHVLSHWRSSTGLSRLCFSGGVAHNSSLNGRILDSGLFDEMYVHPASHDAGTSIGAALVVEGELGGGDLPRRRIQTANYGPDLGTEKEIAGTLRSWRSYIEYEHVDDVVNEAAKLLAAGAVLGWATGRSEFGPRALGNRSIIADPRPVENKTRINEIVKKREGFRPFAPAVTAEAAADYFAIPSTRANFDFMSYVVPVRQARRGELGAVTHVDGSARIQVVDKDANGRFHRLISRFGELTGTPVLLNTSFNNNAEPIVQSVDDSVTCFLTTDLDYLVVEEFLVRKRPLADDWIAGLVPWLVPNARLVEMVRAPAGASAAKTYEVRLVNSVKPARASISQRAFTLLEAADRERTVRELAQLNEGLTDQDVAELATLWAGRFIGLTPS